MATNIVGLVLYWMRDNFFLVSIHLTNDSSSLYSVPRTGDAALRKKRKKKRNFCPQQADILVPRFPNVKAAQLSHGRPGPLKNGSRNWVLFCCQSILSCHPPTMQQKESRGWEHTKMDIACPKTHTFGGNMSRAM